MYFFKILLLKVIQNGSWDPLLFAPGQMSSQATEDNEATRDKK